MSAPRGVKVLTPAASQRSKNSIGEVAEPLLDVLDPDLEDQLPAAARRKWQATAQSRLQAVGVVGGSQAL